MNAKALPARPSLEQYKKQAKNLVKILHSAAPDPASLQRIRQFHPRLGQFSDSAPPAAKFSLADSQLVIAREHGFESWPKFAGHIQALVRKNSPVSKFESAVDAIVAGDLPGLARLLAENPGLVRERSTRTHRATLLHYVGANGVENYRQKTPKNAVQIITLLLRAGASVDAIADIYGGSATLGLIATSVHPFVAGVQEPLLDLLLEHGAAFEDAPTPDHAPQLVVNACLANGRGHAALHLAKRGARLDLEGAAGVGQLDLVKTFFNADRGLKPGATIAQAESGLMWACQYGHPDVARFLLEMGVKVDAMPRGETALHWAAYAAHVDILKLLLERKAPVIVIDRRHNCTPLDWALHGWSDPAPEAVPGRYYEVVARLVTAGAPVDTAWLAHPHHRRPLLEKIHADPRMTAALKGQLPAP